MYVWIVSIIDWRWGGGRGGVGDCISYLYPFVWGKNSRPVMGHTCISMFCNPLSTIIIGLMMI